MSESRTATRPPQVTVAGWVAVVGSVFLVMSSFDQVATLRTLDSRELWARALGEPPYRGLGVGLDQWLDILHVLYVVVGGAAAAAGVLGFHALKGNKAARIGLTVVAVPLLVVGVLSGFLAVMVGVSALLMWSGPASDWFAGRPVRGTTGPSGRPLAPPPPGAATPPAGPPTAADLAAAPPPVVGAQLPPHHGFGARPVAPVQVPRPAPVSIAVVVTVVASLVTTLGVLVLGVLQIRDREVFEKFLADEPRYRDAGLTVTDLQGLAAVGLGVLVLWALAAAGLALLTWWRHEWAWVLLIISGVVSGILSFLAAAMLLPIVPAIASVVAVNLLLRPESRRWFSGR